MKNNLTKEKVIESATSLFFQKGFAGTSVRDIADQADVNVSLISYYFKGKQGLLEYTVTQFYEMYLKELEETIEQTQDFTALEKLKAMIHTIIQYKQNDHQLTCFIHRELSLDSVFVREVTVTYLAKENHYMSQAFFSVLKENNIKRGDHHLLYMQLKGMLMTPYVMQSEWRHQLNNYPNDLFVSRYVKIIENWLDFIILQADPVPSHSSY